MSRSNPETDGSTLRRLLHRLWQRITGRGRPHEDRELDDELRFHIEMETDKNVRRGMEPEEARRRAVLEFGGMERFKEECREQRKGSRLDMLTQDLRYALRMLRKSPGFTVAAVLTLALGIGANTAIFSVVHGVLLSPLPYRHGDRLVLLQEAALGMDLDSVGVSIKEVHDYRTALDGLDGIVEFHQMFFVLLGRGEPQRVQTGVVSANFFDVLGVRPLHGRLFADDDDELGAEPTLVLSHGYWQRAFGGDPDIVGEAFEMNDRAHTVIGVLPPIPQFPAEMDVYMTTSACPYRSAAEERMNEDRRAFDNLQVFGRLAPGVSVQGVSHQAETVAERWSREYPDVYPSSAGFTARATGLKEVLTRNARPMMLLLLVTAALVLLIACANVANLTLARVVRRERELAVRKALGAGRGRLLRQLVTESTVLSLLGGTLGVVMAYGTLDVLRDFTARFTPRAVDVEMNLWVLGFALLVSLLTGLAFGTLPALPRGAGVVSTLKDGAGRASAGGHHGLRRGLIVAQVAIAFTLLVGAGLTLRSLDRLARVDPGFETERVLTARVSMNWANYEDMEQARNLYFSELHRRLQENPRIRASALANQLPLASGEPFEQQFEIEGKELPEDEVAPRLVPVSITPGYFEALGIPLLQGRDLGPGDDAESTPVAVITRSMAERYWSGENPVGARVSLEFERDPRTIVGVVGDTRFDQLQSPEVDQLFYPIAQGGMATWIVIRTSEEPTGVAAGLKETAYSLGAENPISQVQPMATLRDDALASPRLTAQLLGLFAMLALVVTVTGIAGVMAYSVSQRTREMGIRMALGARTGLLLAMVLRQGLALVLVGLLLGAVGATAFTRVMGGLLYEVEPTDPVTFAGVLVVLLGAAVAACLVPARRATAIDPMIALRDE